MTIPQSKDVALLPVSFSLFLLLVLESFNDQKRMRVSFGAYSEHVLRQPLSEAGKV